MAEEITQKFETVIPAEVKEQLERLTCNDYYFYQSCKLGKFWNEVPLPEIVEILFERFCQLAGADENGEFAISVYDMSDSLITFSTEEEMDELLMKYDFEPFDKMFWCDGAWFCG